MKNALQICFTAALPSMLWAQGNPPLLQNGEFSDTVLRQDRDCGTAWYGLQIINRLGNFDEYRFGSDTILRQIADNGCDKTRLDLIYRDAYGTLFDESLLIGISRQSILGRVQALLAHKATPTSARRTRQQACKSPPAD